jgi:hypothetical protein
MEPRVTNVSGVERLDRPQVPGHAVVATAECFVQSNVL